METKINIAIVDDHSLLRTGLVKLIKSLDPAFEISIDVSGGQELFERLKEVPVPNIALVDIDMPVMNGFDVAAKLRQDYPKIPVLILTMMSDEDSLIKMIRLGVKGYLNKDVDPDELHQAIKSVAKGNFHYNEAVSGKLIDVIQSEEQLDVTKQDLSERDLKFLELCCTELTYKEIAALMFLSPKTIDGYRAQLFERFNAKSRVGLVLLAIKNEWVQI